MRPDERELDDEIRGHLALSIHERIERGEDPDAARRAALGEFGYIPAVRDSMRGVWYSRGYDAAADFGRDLRIGLRSLLRARGLAATVVLTLALGIGANAAIASVVRGVLFRPLVNRGEDRLVYVRQSAPGIGAANLTFSVPEIHDLASCASTIEAFGDFSTIDLTLVGLGEPRVVQAGVVGGDYFAVMGLRPALGRLLDARDDGPDAAPVAVLTHGFWTTVAGADPSIVGRTVRLGSREATVVGVLEPSLPYPADTEIIANVVTSPHHLGATMVTERRHRMTELFGRLAPGSTVEDARAELTAAHAEMMRRHPEAYSPRAEVRISVTPLREQLTAPARPVLLVLLAVAGIVFVIACANTASLILARSVRREGELAVRAALGASPGALRRTLLAESLVLCGAGALLGVLLARPFVGIVSSFAARFSVRAHDVTLDAGFLWAGAGMALAAAVVFAYIPRLPGTHAAAPDIADTSARMTPRTSRRLRAFAVAQIAGSFVLLAVAAALLAALVALQSAPTGLNMRQVLAVDVPVPLETGAKALAFYEEATRRLEALPGVEGVAAGNFVPWRDAGSLLPSFQFSAEDYAPAPGEEDPHGRLRIVSPGFFEALGIPMVAGRDFGDEDRAGGDPVVIVSRSVAGRMFADGNALGRRVWWTDPLFAGPPRRIVGVVEDVDDERVVPGPALTIYHPLAQVPFAGRLFIHAAADPYALVPAVTRTIREISADQPVDRPATLEDVRAAVLAPDRVNAFVVSGFAGVALLIAVVGVAGVLMFGVSARTREFGVRLALGSTPRLLLERVLLEGAVIAVAGILAGSVVGYAAGRIAANHMDGLHLPGVAPMAGAALLLTMAAVAASLVPAARAARVDVLHALRSE